MRSLPIFTTKRLILRGVTEADAENWQMYFDDYEVIRNLSAFVPWPYPKDGVITFLKNQILPNQGKDRWVWGLFLKENPNELIGSVDLWRTGKPENRGFWLAQKYWKQGLMTEAVEPIMDYAFNELGFDVLSFANAVGNVGSRRVKEKTGAKLLRVEPARFVDPRFTEHEVWELRKEDWFKNRLSSERLRLRRLESSDFENMRLLESDPFVMKFTPAKVPQSEEQTRKRLNDQITQRNSLVPFGIWVAELKSDSSFVGWFMLMPRENKTLELGFMLVQKSWNNGFATEACKALIDFSKTQNEVKKLVAKTTADNTASMHTLKKLGFIFSETVSIGENKANIFKLEI